MFPFIPQVYRLFVLNNTLRISWGKYPYRCSSLYICTRIKQAAIGNLNKSPCSAVPVNILLLPFSYLSYFPFDQWNISSRFRPWKVFRPNSIKPPVETMAISQNTYSANPVHALGKFLEVNKCTLRTWPSARFPHISLVSRYKGLCVRALHITGKERNEIQCKICSSLRGGIRKMYSLENKFIMSCREGQFCFLVT